MSTSPEIMMHVLLIDDAESSRLLVTAELQQDFAQVTVEQIATASSLVAKLKGEQPMVVMVAFELGWDNGLDVATRVRHQWSEVPIIILAEYEEQGLEALKLGMDEYVLRVDDRVPDMVPAVRGAVARAKARTREVFHVNPLALFVCSAEGALLRVNEAFVRLLGAPGPAVLVGRHLEELIHQRGTAFSWSALVSSGNDTVSVQAAVSYGTQKPVEVWIRLRRAGGRQHSGWVYSGALEERSRVAALEQELLLNQERFHCVAEANLAGVYVVSGTTFSYVNPALAGSLGYRPSELIGKIGPVELIHPNDRYLMEESLVQMGEEQTRFQVRALHRDGPVVVWEVLARHVESAGSPVVVGTVLDTTKSRATEYALRESQRTLSVLMSNLPGMVYRRLPDSQWTMQFLSQGCLELTGYTPGDLVGNKTIAYAKLVNQDDLTGVQEAVERAVRQRQPFTLEYRITNAKGETRWMWEQGQGVTNENDELLFCEGLVCDLTDRRRAEHLLRESEAWYRALFEGATDAVVLLQGLTVIDCNRQTSRLFGTGRDELKGAPVQELSPQCQDDGRDSAQLLEERVHKALEGKRQVYEWQFKRRSGELFDAEVSLSRVDVGGTTYLQQMIRDITARKSTQAGLQRREQILSAVSFATTKLLRTRDWEELIEEVLERFGTAAGVSRVYLMEQPADGNEKAAQHSLHQWTAPGVESLRADPVPQLLFPKDVDIASWSTSVRGSAVVHGDVCDFPEDVQEMLREQEIASLAVVPVIVEARLWGFFGVDECRRARVWTSGEKEAIRAAADTFAGAVLLRRMQLSLEHKE